MKLLITRPLEDAIALAEKLRAMGHIPMVEPLFDIRGTTHGLPALDGFSALIFTSANGVRAFVAASSNRCLPAYAVGDRTAKALQEAGFTMVQSAAGDSTTLAALIRRQNPPKNGAMLHVAGTEVAGDLAETLRLEGYRVERIPLYEAYAASSLSPAASRALAEGQLDGILFFSPRTARLFCRLIDKADLVASLATVSAWCLSPAVAENLLPFDFAKVLVAPEPTQAALLHMIETSSESSIILTAAIGERALKDQH